MKVPLCENNALYLLVCDIYSSCVVCDVSVWFVVFQNSMSEGRLLELCSEFLLSTSSMMFQKMLEMLTLATACKSVAENSFFLFHVSNMYIGI